jgi:hypothetical protein
METKIMRNIIATAMLAMMVIGFIALLGCSSATQEYNWQTGRFEQVGPRDVYRHPAKTERTLDDLGDFPASPAKVAKPQPTANQQNRTYRLYVGSKLPQQSQADENFYLAKQAPVSKLTEVLAVLYPGQGPGGSKDFRYMLYRNHSTLKDAVKMAALLDVAPLDFENTSKLAGDQSHFENALGFLYGSDFPRKLDINVRAKIILLLDQVIENPALDRKLRWSAAILAGNLLARFGPRNYIRAKDNFSRASEFIPGDSYESLVAKFHSVQILMTNNQALTAKQQAMRAVNYFQNLQTTECYEYLRNIASGNY